MNEFVYRHETPAGPIFVSGVQVGYFAVRAELVNETVPSVSTGLLRRVRGWVVDHWPSGLSIVDAPSFADAMVLADDLSRFCANEADGTSSRALAHAFGPMLTTWFRDVRETGVVLPYREWCALRTGAAA